MKGAYVIQTIHKNKRSYSLAHDFCGWIVIFSKHRVSYSIPA